MIYSWIMKNFNEWESIIKLLTFLLKYFEYVTDITHLSLIIHWTQTTNFRQITYFKIHIRMGSGMYIFS